MKQEIGKEWEKEGMNMSIMLPLHLNLITDVLRRHTGIRKTAFAERCE